MRDRMLGKLDAEALAKQIFQSIDMDKYNHLHIYLDGLKNPLDAERTQKIIFLNESDNKSGESHA